MKKIFNLLTVTVAALGLFGLVSCGGNEAPAPSTDNNQTETGNNESSNESTENKTETETETETQPEEKGELFMSVNQELPGMGAMKCELFLINDNTCKFDVTTGFDFLNEVLDQKASYRVVNGLYRFDYDRGEGEAKEHVSLITKYDANDKTLNVKFTAKGDKEVDFNLKSAALETAPANVLLTNTQMTGVGPVICDVVLLDDTNVKFDVTTVVPSYDNNFDVTGTYTVADGVYTFTLGDKTLTTTLTDGVYTLDYTIVGDMEINFKLSSF